MKHNRDAVDFKIYLNVNEIERKEKENVKIYFYMLLDKSTNYMTEWKIQDAEKLHRARPVDEEKKVLFYI